MEELSRLSPETIVFPGLGLEFEIGKEAFSIFGFSIKWYGLMIGIGLLVALSYCFKRARKFGVETDRLIDATMAGVVGAIIGARGYYVALHPDNFHNIMDILAIRDGGLAIYGGIIGGLLAGGITAKLRGLKVRPCFDLAAMGFFIGQCFGRWGNFFNQECFGGNTTLPWGMSGGVIQNYLLSHKASLAVQGMEVNPYLPVHPCFLYESLWCFAGFWVLHFTASADKRKFDGQLFCMYVLWYGLGRFFIEGMRTDSLYIGSFRASQMLALLSALAAAAVLTAGLVHAKKKGVSLYRDSKESKALLAEADRLEKEAEEQAAEKKARKKGKTELKPEERIVEEEDR
ncbi:MAG: prolipoprotein diacylglyceryl transferase [Ruminococcus sp.]|nr:prolipoprotein diacylglyceryl transferase [Ruminococcus sp.]